METTGETLTNQASEIGDDERAAWPRLPFEAWRGTKDTLHMWTQVVGKLPLALAPRLNHWWHVPFTLTSRGLTTAPIPQNHGMFDLQFDFCSHELSLHVSDGRRASLPLEPCSVAEFYRRFTSLLRSFELDAPIWPVPVEVPHPIPFSEDDQHAEYDARYARRFWQILLQTDRVLRELQHGYWGKTSPVQFFWGGFDLSLTRYSGRRAPPHPPVPGVPRRVVQEAYTHELWDAGFWPGDDRLPEPAFFSYAYPEPPGFRTAPVGPDGAYYDERLGEFILPYDVVRSSSRAGEILAEFFDSTYAAAADLGGWDRAALERPWPEGPDREPADEGAPDEPLLRAP